MWQRLKRMFRSIFGAFISVGEDPERILQQNIRDMNDQVPQMNAQIAMVRANLTLVEKEAARHESELSNMTSKLKAALSQGREELAMEFALSLENLKAHASRSRSHVETARAAYEKARDVKKAFMREKELKTREAMEALRAARQSKWQAQVADVMQSFEPAGIDATHDEMIRKVEEQTALDSARLDLALETVEVDRMKTEEEAERIRAKELVEQFKVEMGIEGGEGEELAVEAAEAVEEEAEAAPAPRAKAKARSKGSRTIGKSRSKA